MPPTSGILLVSQYFGLFPFTNNRISVFWLIYSVVLHIVIVHLLYLVQFGIGIKGIGYAIGFTSSHLVTGCHIFQLFVDKRYKFVLYCVNDRTLVKGFSLSYCLAFFSAFLTSNAFYILDSQSPNYWVYVSNSLNMISDFMAALVMIQVCLSFKIILKQVRLSRKVLKTNAPRAANEVSRLMQIGQRIFKFYSPQLLAMSLRTFLCMVIITYRVVSTLRTASVFRNIGRSCITLYYIGSFFYIVRMCEQLNKYVEYWVPKVPTVLYVAWIIGLVPLSSFRPSSAWIMYSLTVHGLISTVLVASMYFTTSVRFEISLGDWMVTMVDGTSVLFVTVSHIYKLLSDPFSRLVLRWVIHPQQRRLYTVFYPLLACAYLAISWALLLTANNKFWARMVNSLSCFGNFATFLVILMFCGATDVIAGKIESLVPVLCVSTNSVADRNLLLLRLAERLNDFFSPQLLMLCFKVFLSITLGIYRFLTDSKHHQHHHHHINITSVCRLMIVTYNVVLLLLVVNVCNNCATAAQAFNSELFRLMRKREDLCSNKKLVLHVTMKQSIKFTACGFFTLGYPLITSIFAGATTYLVILMQLS